MPRGDLGLVDQLSLRILRLIAVRGVATARQVRELLGVDENIVWRRLSRLASDGYLVRVDRGRYALTYTGFLLLAVQDGICKLHPPDQGAGDGNAGSGQGSGPRISSP